MRWCVAQHSAASEVEGTEPATLDRTRARKRNPSTYGIRFLLFHNAIATTHYILSYKHKWSLVRIVETPASHACSQIPQFMTH